MNRDNLLKAIFSDKARELPSPYDDVSATLWGSADAEDEDAETTSKIRLLQLGLFEGRLPSRRRYQRGQFEDHLPRGWPQCGLSLRPPRLSCREECPNFYAAI